MLYSAEGGLAFRYDDHQLRLEPWGPNALRIRATKLSAFPSEDWALSEKVPLSKATVDIPKDKQATASITNGKIHATVSQRGKVIVYNTHTKTKLLEEYARNRKDVFDPKTSALDITPSQIGCSECGSVA